MSVDDQYPNCPVCGAEVDEPCRRGPGLTGDGATSCGDGLSNIVVTEATHTGEIEAR
jgi:hypothetical protein